MGYVQGMLTQVGICRETGNGKYGDVLDVAEVLAQGDYGTAANAIVVMARQSPLFQKTLREIGKGESVPVNDAQP